MDGWPFPTSEVSSNFIQQFLLQPIVNPVNAYHFTRSNSSSQFFLNSIYQYNLMTHYIILWLLNIAMENDHIQQSSTHERFPCEVWPCRAIHIQQSWWNQRDFHVKWPFKGHPHSTRHQRHQFWWKNLPGNWPILATLEAHRATPWQLKSVSHRWPVAGDATGHEKTGGFETNGLIPRGLTMVFDVFWYGFSYGLIWLNHMDWTWLNGPPDRQRQWCTSAVAMVLKLRGKLPSLECTGKE